ncbi:MAG: NAD-dependent epimerase/dehydratase family protein, partial [Fulvivirga sp.]|nr:NAD-dependent epimerase/dehydratase family protein [Fulvivirga sp.]
MTKVLVTGACGQLGSELTIKLREKFGEDNVIATDVREPSGDLADGPFEILDVMNEELLTHLAEKHQITQVYHLAAILSANAEGKPLLAWDLNMKSLLNVLELAKIKKL